MLFLFLSLSLSSHILSLSLCHVSPRFSIIEFSVYSCCGLDCSFLLPMSCCVCVYFFRSAVGVCTHKHQSMCACVHPCVHVCVMTVHASLLDALISARCSSAPSCPCGWPLIETNQACDGPIAVTPHPSHPWPNHLLIGPRRAPSRWHGRLI